LGGHKERLKQLIEQEFALFFMNSVNTMETISSFTNNNNNQSLKKGSVLSNNKNQSSGNTMAFGHSKNKSRTLHRQSSTLKLSSQQQSNQFSTATSTKPYSPWISIQ
jgi:hypothetical protein